MKLVGPARLEVLSTMRWDGLKNGRPGEATTTRVASVAYAWTFHKGCRLPQPTNGMKLPESSTMGTLFCDGQRIFMEIHATEGLNERHKGRLATEPDMLFKMYPKAMYYARSPRHAIAIV